MRRSLVHLFGGVAVVATVALVLLFVSAEPRHDGATVFFERAEDAPPSGAPSLGEPALDALPGSVRSALFSVVETGERRSVTVTQEDRTMTWAVLDAAASEAAGSLVQHGSGPYLVRGVGIIVFEQIQ